MRDPVENRSRSNFNSIFNVFRVVSNRSREDFTSASGNKCSNKFCSWMLSTFLERHVCSSPISGVYIFKKSRTFRAMLVDNSNLGLRVRLDRCYANRGKLNGCQSSSRTKVLRLDAPDFARHVE